MRKLWQEILADARDRDFWLLPLRGEGIVPEPTLIGLVFIATAYVIAHRLGMYDLRTRLAPCIPWEGWP